MKARSLFGRLATGALVAGALGCANAWPGSDYYERQDRIAESDAQVTGEALVQRKLEMQRAHRDMLHMHTTLQTLRRHRAALDIRDFEASFLDPYLAGHLDPLLSSEDEGWHAELQQLDANLLFAKGALLVEVGKASEVERVIREIEGRFEGKDDLLVEYPIGSRNTLRRALGELTRKRFTL